jgi:tetratricopeptide (TPR) repeat protein
LTGSQSNPARYAERMLRWYEHQVGLHAELQLLGIVGLFDRTADEEELRAVLEGAVVEGLNDRARDLNETERSAAWSRLQKLGLIAAHERIDTHPLIRGHFGERLRARHPAAWQEGHRRLLARLRPRLSERPKTLADLVPVYDAIRHACRAEEHADAFELYERRVRQGDTNFSTAVQRAVGSDFAALSGFFVDGSFTRPVNRLTDPQRCIVCRQTAYCLRCLGRHRDSAVCYRLAVEASPPGSPERPALHSGLSHCHLELGELPTACEEAAHAVASVDAVRTEKHSDETRRLVWQVRYRTYHAHLLAQCGRDLLPAAQARLAETLDLRSRIGLSHRDPKIRRELRSMDHLILHDRAGVALAQAVFGEPVDLRGLADEIERVIGSSPGRDEASAWCASAYSLGLLNLRLAETSDPGIAVNAAAQLQSCEDAVRAAERSDLLPHVLNALARLHAVSGEAETAERRVREARRLQESANSTYLIADCEFALAKVLALRGSDDEARRHLDHARRHAERMGRGTLAEEIDAARSQLDPPHAG